MEILELQALLSNYEELKNRIAAEQPPKDIAEYIKQYDPLQHDVMDTAKRPDKQVTTDAGPSTVPVARLPISMQKKIVRFAVTFLCGNPIKLLANPEEGAQAEFLAMVQKVWDDNKLDYSSKGIATRMMTQLQAAEIWYSEVADPMYWVGTPFEGAKLRLRMKVVSPKSGDTLFPVFNSVGDMIAFGRGYSITIEGKLVERFDLYTDTAIYYGTKGDQGWAALTEKNFFGKIPVIYYSQEVPEWSDVQKLIDRLEVVQSNLGDTNDYFGSPLVKLTGEVKGFSKKGEQGKVVQLESGADADYLTWDNSPESVKLEYDKLRAAIHELTDTPDIDFEKIKGLGTLSGVALKMMFMGAHMKASEHEETFGECIQRRINLIKSALAIINMKYLEQVSLTIKPGFEYFLPKNDVEKIDMLVAATGGGILSKKTATALNPLVQDPETEWETIEAEASASLDPTL